LSKKDVLIVKMVA